MTGARETDAHTSHGWLVVNADDLGVSMGSTLGILRAHRDGIVTSASLAVTTPFYDYATEVCVRKCPGLGVGLHLTLTSGKPVTRAEEVPLLVNDAGFFRWRFTSLLRALSINRRPDLMYQIHIEIEAQIQKMMSDGIRPDHIDGERHVQLIPGIFEKVVEAAKRHRIRFVRAGSDISVRAFPLSRVAVLGLRGGFAKSLLLSALSRRARRQLGGGVSSADHVASYLASGYMHLAKPSVLDAPAAGITEIMVHPGIPKHSAGVSLGNRDVEKYLVSPDRQRELDFCIASKSTANLSTLTNFTQLAERYHS